MRTPPPKYRLSPINYACFTLFLIWLVIVTGHAPSRSTNRLPRYDRLDDAKSSATDPDDFQKRAEDADESTSDDVPLTPGKQGDDDDEEQETNDVVTPQEDDDDAVASKRSFPGFSRIEGIINTGKYVGNDTNFVLNPGVPRDAHRWKGDVNSIRTWRDLPRIFPRELPKDDGPSAIQAGAASNPDSTTVCVFNRVPRQRSLFSSGILALFGSGKYHYKSMEATNCQFFGSCPDGTPEESRRHPECNPKTSPTVGLVEWVKCCFHDRFQKAMKAQHWDVAIATGDEYCASFEATGGRAHYRFYFTDAKMKFPFTAAATSSSSSTVSVNRYLPLGPREEFKRMKPFHVVVARRRKYLFNFVGSLTSPSRRRLAAVLKQGATPGQSLAFTHITSEWAKEITRSNGYLLPSDYRRVLLNSTFTLCPDGHNPEAYRIFEACEAGSIPIVALDSFYVNHECSHAFAPFIRTGAPFVYLNGWRGLKPFLQKVADKPELLQRMQADVMDWYARFMRSTALEFEELLERRFRARLAGGGGKEQRPT